MLVLSTQRNTAVVSFFAFPAVPQQTQPTPIATASAGQSA